MQFIVSGILSVMAIANHRINAVDSALARANSRTAVLLRTAMGRYAPRPGADHPYSRGHLNNGIIAMFPGQMINDGGVTVQLEKTDAAVISSVPYSKHVEEGTKYMAAMPYFEPGIDEVAPDYPKILREEMRK